MGYGQGGRIGRNLRNAGLVITSMTFTKIEGWYILSCVGKSFVYSFKYLMTILWSGVGDRHEILVNRPTFLLRTLMLLCLIRTFVTKAMESSPQKGIQNLPALVSKTYQLAYGTPIHVHTNPTNCRKQTSPLHRQYC